MQPYARMSLQELALINPVAAYGRIRGFPTAPVSLNCEASFSSFTLDQTPIQQPLDQTVQARTWIDNITFELQLPNAFVGNIFLPQALAALKESPGVSVRTTVMSGPRYMVTPTFTPLENYTNLFQSSWVAHWQLLRNQQLLTEFILTAIPFNDSSNTPPYNVTITYNGWQFLNPACDDMTAEDAQLALIKAGVLTKDTGIPRGYDPNGA